jgi:hypothetical protein
VTAPVRMLTAPKKHADLSMQLSKLVPRARGPMLAMMLTARAVAQPAPEAGGTSSGVSAPPAPAANVAMHKAISNADVLEMCANHLSDATVIGVIDLSEQQFDVSPDALIALKKSGVSDAVISAMLEARRRQHEAASVAAVPATPAISAPASLAAAGMPALMNDPRLLAAQARLQSMGIAAPLGMPMGMSGSAFAAPRVYRVDGAERSELTASSAQRAMPKMSSGAPSEGASMLRSLASQALRFAAIGGGPAGMAAMSGFSMFGRLMPGMHPSAPTVTYAWGLPGVHSSRDLSSGTPAFELRYADIPGIDPDAYEPALLHLVLTKDNYRLLGATRQSMARMDMSSGAAEWIAEERVPVAVTRQDRGIYILKVTQALSAGEYGVALRPVKRYKGQQSAFSSGELLTAMVWDFTAPLPAAKR